MPEIETSSLVQRADRPDRDSGRNHRSAIGIILALSLMAALMLQLVQLVILFAPVGTAIYFASVTQRSGVRVAIICVLVLGSLLLFTPSMGAVYLSESLFGLLFGWWQFVARTLPDVRFSMPEVATFAVVIVPLTLGAHFVLRRFHRLDEAGRRNWSLGQSLRVVCLFVLSFVAGLACVGAVHQSDWLLNSEDLALDYQDGGMFSRHKLYDMGDALHAARDDADGFPFGITSGEGQALHSWQTMLLPHLGERGLHDQIDLQQSWRATANRRVFEQPMEAFQSQKFFEQEMTTDGYAASHFAANVRVIRPGGGMNPDNIADGAAQTILAGEVADNFRAWGDPFNLRDPGLGLNHPDGFATPWNNGPSRHGVFLFADGHVQTIRDDIDPAIFKALGTPNAGDEVGEF